MFKIKKYKIHNEEVKVKFDINEEILDKIIKRAGYGEKFTQDNLICKIINANQDIVLFAIIIPIFLLSSIIYINFFNFNIGIFSLIVLGSILFGAMVDCGLLFYIESCINAITLLDTYDALLSKTDDFTINQKFDYYELSFNSNNENYKEYFDYICVYPGDNRMELTVNGWVAKTSLLKNKWV